MLRYVLLGVVSLLLCSVAPALALSYSGLPFRATVIDAATKEPIEGVIVVATWRLEFRNGNGAGFLTNTEAVTDKGGYFTMPGWGPLDVGIHQGRVPRMDPNQPGLFLFKPGYEPGGTQGTHETYYLRDPMWNGDSVRAVSLDGQTIPLRRWTKSEEQYDRNIAMWKNSVGLSGCGWARAPRMTAALIREGERLKHVNRYGYNDILSPDDLEKLRAGNECGMTTKAILDEAFK